MIFWSKEGGLWQVSPLATISHTPVQPQIMTKHEFMFSFINMRRGSVICICIDTVRSTCFQCREQARLKDLSDIWE